MANEKWADYCISDVRFNARHTHIDQVKVRPDNGQTIGEAEVYSRQTIINSIKNGITFVSIFFRNNEWHLGRPVFIVTIHGEEFIKTVRDNTKVDNLDDLPEF